MMSSLGLSTSAPSSLNPAGDPHELDNYQDDRSSNQSLGVAQSQGNRTTQLKTPVYNASILRQTFRALTGFEPPGTELSPTPTATLTPTPRPTSTSTPTPTPTPQFVNGLSTEDFVVMDDLTRLHVREIFSDGKALGRDPRALSRIGASIIETDQFLVRFGTGDFDLGPFNHLQPVVEYFSNSFERYGVGIKRGLSAWAVLDPAWADKRQCQANETMIACEFRLNNPSVLIIVLGTNDIGSAEKFEGSMRQIVEYAISEGVIPILATKADRFEGGDNRNNDVIRQIAAAYRIPLWDFDVVAGSLPGRGLGRDSVHLTFVSEFDYNQPASLQRGYGVFNLTILMVLDEVWREMKQAEL
ncbi:MAG: SGNH/GDSL hydrolase family protein [Candidatus Promineifilaceae bacterium]